MQKWNEIKQLSNLKIERRWTLQGILSLLYIYEFQFILRIEAKSAVDKNVLKIKLRCVLVKMFWFLCSGEKN